jgi:hypothetical protein
MVGNFYANLSVIDFRGDEFFVLFLCVYIYRICKDSKSINIVVMLIFANLNFCSYKF